MREKENRITKTDCRKLLNEHLIEIEMVRIKSNQTRINENKKKKSERLFYLRADCFFNVDTCIEVGSLVLGRFM